MTVTRLPQGVPVGEAGMFTISGVVDNVYAVARDLRRVF